MTKRILAYIVLSILIAEATLRVTVFLGDYLQRNTFLSSLKEEGHGKQMFENLGIHPLGWRLIPGEYGGISINQLRFRGAAPKTPKPSNTFRVAVLGDSEAFGMNLQESETVPGILQTMLQQRDVHAEVLNLGVPGYGLDQYLLQLRETALSLEPDVVVLYLNFNDLDLKRRVFFLPESGIAKYSYLARLFKLIQSGTLLTRGSTAESLTSLYQSLPSLPTFPRAIQLVQEICATAQSHRAKCIVLIAPEILGVKNFSSGYPYHKLHKSIRDALAPQLDVIDPLPLLDNETRDRSPHDLYVSPTDPHKNVVANIAITKALLPTIVNSSAIQLQE